MPGQNGWVDEAGPSEFQATNEPAILSPDLTGAEANTPASTAALFPITGGLRLTLGFTIDKTSADLQSIGLGYGDFTGNWSVQIDVQGDGSGFGYLYAINFGSSGGAFFSSGSEAIGAEMPLVVFDIAADGTITLHLNGDFIGTGSIAPPSVLPNFDTDLSWITPSAAGSQKITRLTWEAI